jgi:hypothetical protein
MRAEVDLSPKLSRSEQKKYGKSPLPQIHLRYEGEMKDNSFHGLGKLRFVNTNTGFSDWTYVGDFVNGKADGYGELTAYFTAAAYTFKECWFRGVFKQGKPVEGTVILDHHLTKPNTPTVFYTGEVLFKESKLTWHGYGALLKSEYDAKDLSYSRDLGIPGAFYAGQFHQGSTTGFAITNTVDISGRLGPLVTALVGADDIFQQFSDLALYVDLFTQKSFSPPLRKNKELYRLFPKIETVSYGEIPLTKEAVYKGMLSNGLPYGVGYTEYQCERGSYRDLGFWSNGKKLPIRDVLKALLPDSNWLTPKTVDALFVACNRQWNDKTKRQDIICKQMAEALQYHGPVNEQGYPSGWGWMANPTKPCNEVPSFIGKFSGKDPANDKTGKMHADTLMVYTYNQQSISQYNYYDSKKAAQDQYYSEFESGVFEPFGMLYQNGSYKRTQPRIAFAEDLFRDKAHVDYVKFEKEFAKSLSARAGLAVGTVYYDAQQPAKSYVKDINGNIVSGISKNRESLTRGDWVFLYSCFYYVHDSYRNIQLGSSPSDGFWFGEQIPPTVFVINDRNITNIEFRQVYCSGCSDLPPLRSGPATYTGQAFSGRYETNVYQNNSGSSTIVSKPIYNQISITLPPPTRKPCKVCNDNRKNERVPMQVVKL